MDKPSVAISPERAQILRQVIRILYEEVHEYGGVKPAYGRKVESYIDEMENILKEGGYDPDE